MHASECLFYVKSKRIICTLQSEEIALYNMKYKCEKDEESFRTVQVVTTCRRNNT